MFLPLARRKLRCFFMDLGGRWASGCRRGEGDRFYLQVLLKNAASSKRDRKDCSRRDEVCKEGEAAPGLSKDGDARCETYQDYVDKVQYKTSRLRKVVRAFLQSAQPNASEQAES